ncbi:MAG: 3-methylornithyl-N6-L-lysine dehydrogenase PylD [Spirochaetales bacterium]|nr:3-methylornithyl-N6-L-lysine dehydrogenase PylD [Spirochaetales bacterium]
MSRLTAGDVRGIDRRSLAHADRALLESTGLTLFGLACRAAGLEEAAGRELAARVTAAVVPMNCGEGLIPGFAAAVGSILAHLGCRCRVTAGGEVTGLAEAVEQGCDLVFSSDDSRFVAFDLRHRRIVDNASATAHGFAAGLSRLAGGLEGKQVLVVGCGRVGSTAGRRLLEEGARVALHDIDASRARALARELGGRRTGSLAVEPELTAALRRHSLLLLAAPAGGIIGKEDLLPGSRVAAPGVPLGLTPEAAAALGTRLLHDPLQTGVAVMLMEALAP